ncbi:MAG: DUF4431 domain-containing protein [Deltaproteobacteria bacterium]|nr:DUF4431 domain-containing protein [Deltaproteobacteria bacterium]
MKKKFIMRISLTLFFVLGLIAFTGDAQSDECLSYWPAKVRLTGTIVEKILPGPPEFESIEKGDRPDTYWILKLIKPACANTNEERDLSFVAETNIKTIQLVIHGDYTRYEHLVNKKVVAEGTLFHQETGYHRTKVLMEVTDIKPAK